MRWRSTIFWGAVLWLPVLLVPDWLLAWYGWTLIVVAVLYAAVGYGIRRRRERRG